MQVTYSYASAALDVTEPLLPLALQFPAYQKFLQVLSCKLNE